MGYKFNPFTGTLDTVDSPNGVFEELDVNGDITLDDGGTYTTTLQTITPTANRTISFPNATGTLGLVGGSSGQVVYNNAGAYAGVSTMTFDGTSVTLTGRFISSLNGAASAPPGTFTGTWFTGGTATTTKPQVLIEPTGATSTAWSTSGTGLGVNAASGFAGNLLDLQVNGTPRTFSTSNGYLYVSPGDGSSASHGLGFIGRSIGISSPIANTFRLGRDNSADIYISVSAADPYVNLRGAYRFGWAPAGADGAQDLALLRDAAGTLAQRNGTNAQVTRVYDTFTSATDYHRIAIATARATLTNVSGASVTATALIPAGAVVMGVTSKVTTALGTGNGTTGYKIGTAGDDDRWGAITGTAAGTTSDNRNWTAGTIECFPTATDIIVTATGGNFNGTGVIYLSVQYMAGEAD
jgi:hypothetical protein